MELLIIAHLNPNNKRGTMTKTEKIRIDVVLRLLREARKAYNDINRE